MAVETSTRDELEEKPAVALKAKDFKGKVEPDWCPGCGDFGVLSSVQRACANLCLLYTSPSPRDGLLSRMPSSA